MPNSKDARQSTPDRQPTHALNHSEKKHCSQNSGTRHNHRLIAGATLALLCLAAMPGCTAELDAKIAATHADYRGAVTTGIGASRIFADGYDDLASKKHELQATGITREWDAWLSRHTSDDGRLVSRDSDGKIVPLLASDLNAAIALREEANVRLALSRESHTKFSHTYRDALTTLETTTELLEQKSIDWEAARAKAREAQNAILSAVGAAAAFMAGGL